jgi:hypothetical protein
MTIGSVIILYGKADPLGKTTGALLSHGNKELFSVLWISSV